MMEERKALMSGLEKYEPCKSPLRWHGGKFYLAKKIVRLFPEHVCYCEMFCGAAHVFFQKRQSRLEVINDINSELVNFWRVYARRPEYFTRKLEFCLYSRQEFEEAKARDISFMSCEERAWRYFYLNRLCFSGMMDNGVGCPRFGTGRTDDNKPALTLSLMSEKMKDAHRRIKLAIIENLDWRKCINQYDADGTFFYLDPPYEGCESEYGKGIFSRQDYQDMARLLAGIKGKFLLSLSDTPYMREVFNDFKMEGISALYTTKHDSRSPEAHKKRKKACELLVGNYEFELREE